MKGHALVSVVIPAYNAEASLDKCVSSIVGQTYKNLQIVIVDDGSKDRTGSICDAWARKDPRVFVVHKRNGGLPAARNTGLQVSKGDWMLFVDSDDEIEEQSVELLLEKAIEGVDIVSFGWSIVDSKGNVARTNLPRAISPTDQDGLIYEIVRGPLEDYIWSYFFRREKLVEFGEKGPFVEGMTLYEDAVSLQGMLRASKWSVSYLPKALYRYTSGTESMSRGVNPRTARDGLAAVKVLRSFKTDSDLLPYWNSRLILMLMFGADYMAGQGFGDGEGELHREIAKEVVDLARQDGLRGLSLGARIKYCFLRIRCYQVIRRLRNLLRRRGEA